MNNFGSVILSNSSQKTDDEVLQNNNTTKAVREILKNGILVETNKGLVCMSLKDALDNGVGGHSLSAEDFQTVATELLIQEGPELAVPPKKVSMFGDTKPKRMFKQIKKSSTKVKTVSSRTPATYSVADSFTDSQADLEEFKDIQESLLDLSSFECPFLDKVPEECEDLNQEDRQGSEFKTTNTVNEVTSKKILVDRKSLVSKNNMKPVISVQKIVKNLSGKDIVSDDKYKINRLGSVLIRSNCTTDDVQVVGESYISTEETSDNSEVTSVAAEELETKPVKKRGGWPKGRKRKPEVKYENRPPKAPATGYVIFLNEKRKDYRDMPFTEVTKLLGNEWSKLSLQEKKVYLDQAEIEKKRYREELKMYRQSDAYQTYLNKKRLKRLQGNGTEESDMDATDEIDEEDNEELYCRLCDQWFHSLHNKKEHLYGRQHLQSIAGKFSKVSDPDCCNANMSSTSLDESSLDGSSYLKGSKEHCCEKIKEPLNMDEAIVRFMVANKEREEERQILKKKLEESKSKNQSLSLDLQNLNETLDSLTCMMESERTTQILLEQRLFNLLNVPTLFYLPEPLNEDNN